MINSASRPGEAPAPAGGRAWTGSPTAGWARLVRVAAFGGTSLLLASLAHLVGGGQLPGAGLLLVLAVVTGAVAAVVTARRCRLPLLLTVLTVEQVGLHTLFTAGPLDCPAAPAVLTAAMPAGHTGSLICTPGLDATAGHPDPLLMWAGHLLATALTGWLLARGEAVLWRLAERVVRAAHPPRTSWPALAPRPRAFPLLLRLPAPPPEGDAAPRGPPALGATAS